jgi:hypothetical protein
MFIGAVRVQAASGSGSDRKPKHQGWRDIEEKARRDDLTVVSTIARALMLAMDESKTARRLLPTSRLSICRDRSRFLQAA